MDDNCWVPGCEKLPKKRGLCEMHYTRWLRHGDVFAVTRLSLKKYIDDIIAMPPTDDCILWQHGKQGDGYGAYNKKTAHHVICSLVHGQQPSPIHQAAHECGTRLCCNPKHLYWATHQQNVDDRRKHGTNTVGEKNSNAKLTACDVRNIRQQRALGVKPKALAAFYAIRADTISKIVARKCWAHV